LQPKKATKDRKYAKVKNIYSKVNFKSIKLKYYKVSNNFLSENNQNDMLPVTDNEATRPTFVRTRPALHEAENEAEAGCYEAEAENFGLEALKSLVRTHRAGFLCRRRFLSFWPLPQAPTF